jgi:hypothetical protein
MSEQELFSEAIKIIFNEIIDDVIPKNEKTFIIAMKDAFSAFSKLDINEAREVGYYGPINKSFAQVQKVIKEYEFKYPKLKDEKYTLLFSRIISEFLVKIFLDNRIQPFLKFKMADEAMNTAYDLVYAKRNELKIDSESDKLGKQFFDETLIFLERQRERNKGAIPLPETFEPVIFILWYDSPTSIIKLRKVADYLEGKGIIVKANEFENIFGNNRNTIQLNPNKHLDFFFILELLYNEYKAFKVSEGKGYLTVISNKILDFSKSLKKSKPSQYISNLKKINPLKHNVEADYKAFLKTLFSK